MRREKKRVNLFSSLSALRIVCTSSGLARLLLPMALIRTVRERGRERESEREREREREGKEQTLEELGRKERERREKGRDKNGRELTAAETFSSSSFTHLLSSC